MYEWHKEDKCDVCNAARFHNVKGKLQPVKVLFNMGLESALANLFADPEWARVRKKNLDNCINCMHQSEHVRLMDIQ